MIDDNDDQSLGGEGGGSKKAKVLRLKGGERCETGPEIAYGVVGWEQRVIFKSADQLASKRSACVCARVSETCSPARASKCVLCV